MEENYQCAAFIITAVVIETESIKRLYPSWKRLSINGDSQAYYETWFEKDGERHRIITAQQSVMGMTAATVLTMKAIAQFKPRYVIMSGIAAGTGDEARQIYGDVIVPDVIWDYSTGKFVGPDETEIRFGDLGFLPRPRSVYIDEKMIELVKSTIGRDDNEFHVHIGPLACGSSVVANRAVVEKQVLSLFPKTVGLDMESYSVAFSCQNSAAPKPQAIVVKSICDFADSEKSDQYQKFAAYTSSGYTKYLLESILPL
ncbi:MAG: hypothetical protein IJJ41_03280 [Clostridia bacterium]|nr:hypothetical protein [Clostridia bacterium]